MTTEDHWKLLLAYAEASLFPYVLALNLESDLREKKHTRLRFWSVLGYNTFFFTHHLTFFITGHLFFYLKTDSSVVGWLALFMSILHGRLILRQIRSRSWSILNHFDPRL